MEDSKEKDDELEFSEEDLKWSKKFDPMMAEQYIEYASTGRSDADIAIIMGVNRRTLQRWKTRFSELSRSVKEAKKMADNKVKESYYRRCIGYDYKEEKASFDKESGQWVKTTVVKHIPPDPVAAMNWLRLRDPENWKAPMGEPEGDYIEPVDPNKAEEVKPEEPTKPGEDEPNK